MRELCRNQYDFHVVNIIKRILNWFLGFDWRLRCAGLCATKTVLKQARVILITIFLVAIWLLTFWHSCTMQHKKKKWNKIKNRVNQLSVYVSTKIRCIALRYRFFYSIITIKRKPTMLFAYGTSYTLIIFEQTKWYFVLSICSRAHDKTSICLCVVRALYAEWNKKNSDGCNAKIPMQNLYMIWSILSAESFVRLQAVTIIGLLFNGKYTKVVIFFLLRRFVVFKKNIQFFLVAVLMNWGKNVWHKSSIGSIWIVNFLF